MQCKTGHKHSHLDRPRWSQTHQRQENRGYQDGRNIFFQQRNILQQVIQQFQQPPQLEMILEKQRDVMHQLVQEAHRVRQEVKDIKNAMVHALQTVDTNHASHDHVIQAQAQYFQRLTAKQDAINCHASTVRCKRSIE